MNRESLKVVAKGERELEITRVFNASRDLVFDCFTKPELLKRWFYGPDGWSLSVCQIDLRVGGTYRYVWRSEHDGTEMGAGGVYREVQAPERLVCTEAFDKAWYSGESLLTSIFDEQNNQTFYTLTILYESQEARDQVVQSPMEEGLSQGYDRLAKLLTHLVAEKMGGER
ncbi:ATPase [Leptospira perolatii]|uniref:ATPase n=1 Tax=Leptospira perolatii TaxID=2023191 RepID=A0A2M9ZJC3_9LEPT|nr:SRPBCC family protein [Leptospira perolatii]PJZ68829.1 ATPase [Leptospira perolatii]PJZ72160.1 ATPase [Leptospira perolatii]